MFAYKWKDIITSICAVKPECVDKEKIIYNLEKRRDYDDRVLNQLYQLKVIDIEEYIKYTKIIIELGEKYLSYLKSKIEFAEKTKEKFSLKIFLRNYFKRFNV